MLRFFNTLTRRKEVFKPLEKDKVRMYSCGLTVYNFAHIGNLRAYVFVDLLRRWLEYRGFTVKHVMNITDVDDKTIKGMQKEGIPLKAFTQKYVDAFFDDLQLLHIRKAHINPKATEHIEEMVQLIGELLKKGYAYRSDEGSIYYDVSKFKDYGNLSKMEIKKLKAGARVKVDEYDKDQASDFALWKAWDIGDGNVFWETKLGKGRPGWHIECSAMSMKYLGEVLDIHTGGVDNMFPHHENEIAQSEVITGKKFVKYWLHNEHLLIKGERMGKSLKNFYTLRELIEMGYEPSVIRYLLISTHYRKQLQFTLEGLDAAKNTLQRLYYFLERLGEAKSNNGGNIEELIEMTRDGFQKSLDDDLDINGAITVIFNLVKEVNILADQGKLDRDSARKIKNLMMDFDKVLAIFGRAKEEKTVELPSKLKELIEEREKARKEKDWKTADGLRNKLKEKGITLIDTPEGVKWKWIRKDAKIGT
jgi:cysteinyl-tRNA synthetase